MRTFKALCGVFILTSVFVCGGIVRAEEGTVLQSKIEDHEQKIKELEQEITTYEKELTTIGGEKRTLESAVREIDLSRKKVTANIQVEERKIYSLETDIKVFEGEIVAAERSITTLKNGLRTLLAYMHSAEEQTLIEALLKSESLENMWNEIDNAEQINTRLHDRVLNIEKIKENLTITKKVTEEKRVNRLNHQTNLKSEKRSLDITQREKRTLLSTTSQKESSYQKLLAEKRVAKEEFETAMRALESELEYILDPTRIPAAGKGILAWPLSTILVTQKFGNTTFAKSGAYRGEGHNGVDFRASLGTPVKAALAGIVTSYGNTDVYRGCYSYGKWILIKHANGLSTLYAHLSEISVSPNQVIATGETIGYSGNTGYSTGPHLHFGLYVSDAIQLRRIGDIKKKTNCANAEIPVAPLNAYLNPLEYL